MKLTNLSNTFTAFGLFAVLDEDTMALVNKIYTDCNIAINQEPNNPNNKSGKLVRIVNPKRHFTITMRPHRLDLQLPGTDKNNFSNILSLANEIFNNFAEMFEGCYATRIAYVSSDFIFDDEGKETKNLAKLISFLPKQSNANELSVRINTPEVIQGEVVNVVLNVSNVMIGNNQNPQAGQRKAVMITHDVNTLANATEARFDLKYVLPYFEEMHQVAVDHLASFEEL